MAYGTRTTWIVVADGQKARILRYVGPDEGLRLIDNGEMEIAASTRALINDRPGRKEDAMGHSRRHGDGDASGGMQIEEQEDSAFLAHVADRINLAANTGEFQRLVLVAAPRALGELRYQLNENARKMVIGEIDKDLTKERIDDLPRHLGAVMNI